MRTRCTTILEFCLAALVACTAACGVVTDGDADGLSKIALEEAGVDAQACNKDHTGLVITEIMADPLGPDSGREWLELFNSDSAPLCLNGSVLHIGLPWAPKSRLLKGIGCMPPQALWVLGDGTGVAGQAEPFAVHYRYGSLAMPNDQGTVAISCDGQVLDAVEYGTGETPAPQTGRALARVPMARYGSFCVVAGEAAPWGDVGTPGAPNPGCSTCRDAAGQVRPTQGATAADVALEGWQQQRGDGRRPWATATLRNTGRAFDLAGLELVAYGPGAKELRPSTFKVPEGRCQTLHPGQSCALPLLHLRGPASPPGAGPESEHLIFWGRRAPGRSVARLALRQGDVCLADGSPPVEGSRHAPWPPPPEVF